MKHSSYTSSPAAPAMTAVGTGAIALAMLVFCPFLLPLALLSPIVLYPMAKRDIGTCVDAATSGRAEEIAEEWRRNRAPGERGIDVSTTVYSGGALFDLPMTRIHRFELDDDEK